MSSENLLVIVSCIRISYTLVSLILTLKLGFVNISFVLLFVMCTCILGLNVGFGNIVIREIFCVKIFLYAWT